MNVTNLEKTHLIGGNFINVFVESNLIFVTIFLTPPLTNLKFCFIIFGKKFIYTWKNYKKDMAKIVIVLPTYYYSSAFSPYCHMNFPAIEFLDVYFYGNASRWQEELQLSNGNFDRLDFGSISNDSNPVTICGKDDSDLEFQWSSTASSKNSVPQCCRRADALKLMTVKMFQKKIKVAGIRWPAELGVVVVAAAATVVVLSSSSLSMKMRLACEHNGQSNERMHTTY